MEIASSSSPAETLAYLNGEFLPLREARLPVWDLGIVQAVTVTETLRTFRHEPFRLSDHLSRLAGSLRAIGVSPRESMDQLRHLIVELARFNAGSLPQQADLAINLFVTAGESLHHSGGAATHPGRPTVCLTTRPLDLASAARQYREGVHLAISSVRQIPASVIDPRIKYRSRLHWHLADQEVHATDPSREAVLLDLDGFITETARGNVVARFGDRLATPAAETTLAGISQQVLFDLCAANGRQVERANLSPAEFAAADEILLTSTSICVAPVTRLDGLPVGDGRPGPLWQELIAAWSELVEIDILSQAFLQSQS